MTNLDKLKLMGFQHVGIWSLNGEVLELSVDNVERLNDVNVLYCFARNGEVVYVGKTVRPLRKRMGEYRNPSPTQRTSMRNHDSLIDSLRGGSRVELFVLPDNGLLKYGGFHLNLAAGLEDSLIRELKPDWNGGKKENPQGELQPTDPEPVSVSD